MVNERCNELIEQLAMRRHPEGGHYAEVFRSERLVDPGEGFARRRALTAIYFLLSWGEFSCFHRVRSDETWHYHEGDPLEMVVIDSGLGTAERHVLGRQGDGVAPLLAIKADSWQAARPLGGYTFVSCCVAPGFEFEDFSMLRDDSDLVATVGGKWPEWAGLIG